MVESVLDKVGGQDGEYRATGDLKSSIEVWNEWREKEPDTRVDLSETDLSGAKLSASYLMEANLYKANLSEADLRAAILNFTNLVQVNSSNTQISESSVYG